jgi:hypothetical protein
VNSIHPWLASFSRYFGPDFIMSAFFKASPGSATGFGGEIASICGRLLQRRIGDFDRAKAMKRLLRCLEDVQARLGEIHDEEAKAKFLDAEARKLPEEASHIAAFAAGALAAAPRDTSPQLMDALE